MVQASIRHVTFSSGTIKLEGEVRLPPETPAPGIVVCHPHPLYGGDMDNNVVLAACDALVTGGFVALRFNFRGTGASEGEHDDGRGERDDLMAALDFLLEQDEVDQQKIGAVGYSFGAMVAADIASEALSGLALISPPVAMGDLRVEWGCPTILIAGDEDHLAPPERIRIVAQHSRAEVRTVEGAEHSWWGFEREVGDAVSDFFGRHFA
jgi:alpha/beta superfamily hydrolase